MAAYNEFPHHEVTPANPKLIANIWKVTGILALVTAVEFALAFAFPEKPEWLILTYIVLTLVKAFFIVAEFMHLGHEQKSLIYSILLPLGLLFWGILAMLMEADAIYNAIIGWWN